MTNIFLRDVLTDANLKTAVDNLVRRGNEADVIAAQRAPLAQRLAQLDRELVNLTAAIATGQRPDVVLNAIADREKERKAVVAEINGLDKQERLARDFDHDAEEKKLRAELKTWRDMLEREPEHGRAVLRQMLHGPIQAEWDPATDEWTIKAIATFGGVLRRVFAVPVSEAELAAYNAESDRLNALAAANVGGAATSDIHNQSCPRQGSHTGPLAFRGRVFKLGAYLSLPA